MKQNNKLYKFLKDNDNLKISIQSSLVTPGIVIQVYDEYRYERQPLINHHISEELMNKVELNLEDIIAISISNWWYNSQKEQLE